MTPREAAAKCRETIKQREGVIGASDLRAGDCQFHYYDGEIDGLAAAAALIDQIGVPQPWSPPEEMEQVLAYKPTAGWLIRLKGGRAWSQVGTASSPFTHYLPLPPAPEVKG